MFENKSTAQEIIERLSSSYGVKSQRELAKALDIPPNNVSAWVQRGSVPGNSIIKCALDTGAELSWLVNGELAKANSKEKSTRMRGKFLYDEIMSNGGKPVLRRIMDAYGFALQKQLCDLLDLSSGTVSTWVRRDYFPGDVVVTCALDTGVSLEWLATGKGTPTRNATIDVSANYSVLKKYNIDSGVLEESGEWVCDKSLIHSLPENCGFVEKKNESWIVDFGQKSLGNGRWLIDIDGVYDVYDLARIPGNKLELSYKGSHFQCLVSDVVCIGLIRKTITNN